MRSVWLHIFTCLSVAILPYKPCHAAPRVRRVVGGRELTAGAWPWLASLNYKEHHAFLVLQGLRHLCGGTLIHRQWVLTAAHCVHAATAPGLDVPSNWEIVLGEYNRRLNEDREQRMQVEGIFVAPEYTVDPELTGDIALIKLANPVNVTDSVEPIEIDNLRPIPPGTTCQAAGWGQHTADTVNFGNGTIVPHVIDVTAVNLEDCSKAYRRFRVSIDRTVICCSDAQRDTCQGDSGGPMVCDGSDGVQRLTGVVSAGYGCGKHGYPGIYTRIASYRAWMLEIM